MFLEELSYYNGSVVRIYLALSFWQCFAVVSLYVVDMLTYNPNALFEYFVT
jgi:hypothetical protein